MNFGQKALQVLKTVAPTLATAALGPFGPLAGGLISAALGTSTGDDKAAETALLTATPDQLLALTKANQDFQVQMKQLGITEEKLTFDDIANARAMQIATRDPTARQIAWLVIGGFIIFTLLLAAAIIFMPDNVAKISTAAWTLLTTLLTFLASESKAAGSFFFGSSASSQTKDATLAEIAKQ